MPKGGVFFKLALDSLWRRAKKSLGAGLNNSNIVIALAAVLVSLSGCARTGQSALACRIQPVDIDLTKIARRACGGNSNAYLKLAEAYENGTLVARDEQLAIELYRAVSMPTTTPTNTYIYVPGAGKVAGYTMPIQTGMQTLRGNAEAQYRLAMMLGEGRGQVRDVAMAIYYLRLASVQGHVEATNRLNESRLFGAVREPIS